MTDPLKFIPPRVPLLDSRTGLISREWYLFFQGVFDRIGGSNGQSIPDVIQDLPDDAGLEELKAVTFSQLDGLGQLPPQVEAILVDALSELHSLRDQVAELTKTVQDLQQGINI